MKNYVVETQRPSLIFDKKGNPTEGFIVEGTLFPWGEPFEIKVASLAPDVVKAELDQIIEFRQALDELGSEQEGE